MTFDVLVRRRVGGRIDRAEFVAEPEVGELRRIFVRLRLRRVAQYGDADALIGKTHQVTVIARPAARVFDRAQSAVMTDVDAHRVVELVAVVEHAGLAHLFDQRASADAAGREVLFPQR